MTEPMVVPCLFCSGIVVQRIDGLLRLVGWVQINPIEEGDPERRIVVRMVISNETASRLRRSLQRALARSH